MKLIDKDGLMEIVNCNKSLADGYHMKDYVFKQIITDINNQPTVKAIPMEDEKKSLEEYETLLVKIYWYLKGLNLDKDDGDINDLVTMIEELI